MQKSSKRVSGSAGRVWPLSLAFVAAIAPATGLAQVSSANPSSLAPIYSGDAAKMDRMGQVSEKRVRSPFVSEEVVKPPTFGPEVGERDETGRSIEERLNALDAAARTGNISYELYLKHQRDILSGQ